MVDRGSERVPQAAHLTELRALAEKATPGPWFVVANDLIGGVSVSTVDKRMSEHGLREERVPADMLDSEATAAFIAALSPDVVLALLDELEALRAACGAPGSSEGER